MILIGLFMLLFRYIVISKVNVEWIIEFKHSVVKKDHLNKITHRNNI